MLIFNPISGTPGDSPAQFLSIVETLQDLGFRPEVFLVSPERDAAAAACDAYARGVRTFLASGGDGTVDTVAGALAGTDATLAVVPTGTQNNVAFSLGIPADIPGAVRLLREGRPMLVDLARVESGSARRNILEICSVGLLSALFPAADDVQHGNLARLADLLATLVTSPPAEIHLRLDGERELHTQGHVVLVGNMPYVGPHFQIAAEESYSDGLLDVLVFANLTKLDLLASAVQAAGGVLDDPRVHRYQASQVEIETNPPMQVIADGFLLEETAQNGPLKISVLPKALTIMVAREVIR
jgi:YegS/Rv2252/BmrU family lipid kinase